MRGRRIMGVMAEVHRREERRQPEFEVLNPPTAPVWRSRHLLVRREQQARTRPVLILLSLACGLCLLFPDRFDYRSAISDQFAQGSFTARALFGLMFLTLAVAAYRLWTWKRWAGVGLAVFAIALLSVISATDPQSSQHNAAFVGLTLVLLAAHANAWHLSTDGRILVAGLACLAGAVLCPFHIGLAERIIIASSCFSLSVLVLEYLD